MATPSKKNEDTVKKNVKPASKKSVAPVAKKMPVVSSPMNTKSMPTPESSSSKRSHIILIVLLVLNLVVWLLNINSTKSSIIETEALKVWGMENYTKLVKLMKSDEYKKAHSENIDMMTMQIEQMKTETTSWYVDNSTPANNNVPQEINTITPNTTTDFENRSDG